MILLLKYTRFAQRAKWMDKCPICRNKIIIISQLKYPIVLTSEQSVRLPLVTDVHKNETKISAAKQMKRSNHTSPMNFVFGFGVCTCTSCTKPQRPSSVWSKLDFMHYKGAHSECEYFNFTNIYTKLRNTQNVFAHVWTKACRWIVFKKNIYVRAISLDFAYKRLPPCHDMPPCNRCLNRVLKKSNLNALNSKDNRQRKKEQTATTCERMDEEKNQQTKRYVTIMWMWMKRAPLPFHNRKIHTINMHILKL